MIMKLCLKKIKSKISSKHGESLTETLVALLVMCMAMAVISGSIVTAARINRKAEDMETSTMLKAGVDVTEQAKNITVYKGGRPAGGTGAGSVQLGVKYYTDKADGSNFKFYELDR